MPGRMKKHLEEYKENSNPNEIGNNLFESMMVFGPEQKELE